MMGVMANAPRELVGALVDQLNGRTVVRVDDSAEEALVWFSPTEVERWVLGNDGIWTRDRDYDFPFWVL